MSQENSETATHINTPLLESNDKVKEKRVDRLLDGLKNPTNYVAALVVALVAMPLSIALGTASGVTPMMGL
jgi:MFS superfamily sulfate permease-like transporter